MRRSLLLAVLLLTGALAGCARDVPPASDDAGDSPTPATEGTCLERARASLSPAPANGTGEVTLLTHDSFSVDRSVLDAFENETGYTVKLVRMGDAGEALNKAILQKDAPVGDALFGVDNALIHRAKEHGLFQPYASQRLAGVDDRFLEPFCDEGRILATPIDYGHVMLNYDTAWFDERGLPLPADLGDVANETYAPLTVVTNPYTSSPGFAFLLATVDRFGDDGYAAFWRDFAQNGGLVVSGWEEAYGSHFTQGWDTEGALDRPIVLSYGTSPAFNPMMGYTEGATSANLDVPKGAWLQVEAVGILRNAKNPDGAKALVDYMLGSQFQESAVAGMVVWPVHRDATPPEAYALYAPEPQEPASLPPDRIERERDAWLQGWRQATGQV